ncbi:hypothetical protein JNUCC1_00653 [Lentibacillus sp. JNUCC-1]|uniref:hypothetical protein n=1 Tax=Lentibacillus sp. JNUCC-1 TaxID=2654513 RepID=UPI0012E7BC7D|nr:hypothetical protein [Lentibacillus sp. JNUCC-1]MUV36849.1 hypothetical protein [Lentibacillus sp. JNUCC-1]
MTRKTDHLKHKLDEDMQHIHFSGQKDVLKRTHPESFRDKAVAFWNKEISIPLLPVSTVFALVLLAVGYHEVVVPLQPDQTQKTIEVAGNTYWENDFERAVSRYED